MQTSATDSTKPTFLQDLYQSAQDSAGQGAMLGKGFVTISLIFGAFQAGLEKLNRAYGSGPKWPLFDGDCQMEQFAQTTICTQPPLFKSLTEFGVYTVGAFALAGMTIGAISTIAQRTLPKQSSVQEPAQANSQVIKA